MGGGGGSSKGLLKRRRGLTLNTIPKAKSVRLHDIAANFMPKTRRPFPGCIMCKHSPVQARIHPLSHACARAREGRGRGAESLPWPQVPDTILVGPEAVCVGNLQEVALVASSDPRTQWKWNDHISIALPPTSSVLQPNQTFTTPLVPKKTRLPLKQHMAHMPKKRQICANHITPPVPSTASWKTNAGI